MVHFSPWLATRPRASDRKQYILPLNWQSDPHDPRAVAVTGSGLFPTSSGPLTIGSDLFATGSKSGPPRHIPRKVDLRTEDYIIFNQGDFGSCVANALASALIFARDATAGSLEPFEPSRLFYLL